MPTIVEGFESTTAVVPRTGNWVRDQTQRFAGTWSLKSATVPASGGSSSATLTVPAGATTVTFRVKISTEGNVSDPTLYDPFVFLTGATERYRRAGEVDWHQPGTYVLSGATTVVFRYERDNTDGAGSNAVWIDDVTFNIPDTTPPGTPPNLRVTAQGVDSVSVAWDAATDNIGVVGYGVYLDNVKQGADQTGLTYAFAGLSATSHLIEVDAVDGDGNRSAVKASLTVQLDDEPPSTPPNLRVTAVSPDSVSVAWDAATDNIGVVGYGVYLDNVKQGPDQAGLSYVFEDLATSVEYLVEVDAVDAANNRSSRAQLEVAPEADETSPGAPPNLAVTASGPYSVSVAWDAASDNIGVAGYGVYLDNVKQGPDVSGLSYVFEGLSAETSYLIEVDAVDPSDNRSSRAQLTHETPVDEPPGTPPNLEVSAVAYTSWSVSWDPADDDVAVVGYDVAVDEVLVVENEDVLSLAREDLPDDTDYLVQVWAVDQLGQRSLLPAELVVTTLNDEDPTAPELVVTAGEDSITVAWSEAGDDFGVVGYEVLLDGEVVHTTPGVDYTVDGPSERRVTLPSLVAGVGYEVRVSAVDTIGQRSADNTVQVETTPLPFLPVTTPVYRIGGWAANVIDGHGVTWVVERAEGWSSSAPVSPVSARQGGMDGGWSGAGRHGPRRIRLSGVAVAGSRGAMLAAKQRMLRVLHPREQGVLRVTDARMTRQARVRLDGQIRITDQGAVAFGWELELKAADPRRYATSPVSGVAVIGELPGEAEVTVTLAGTYPTIPARLRLFGPIKDFSITHAESGTVMRSMPGLEVPGDHRYSYTIDLASRQVLAHVPPEVWPEPRPGRRSLAHLPAWFQLIPGPNTITLAGDPVAGQEGQPRLVVEAYDAWN